MSAPDYPPPLKEVPKFKGLQKALGGQGANLHGQAAAVGLTFVVAILIGLYAGWWLDQKLGTAPWLLLTGLLVGVAAGFKNLFTLSARLDRPPAEKKNPES
ncbi:MAG: AtpZ/AtpI family protein [Candidatus Adiutrix sp.]|jgi:ATP synthase protein I|nr:AtpZ/AtpI family protein [Candidatus Adiutrix sp.]